jgi:ribokinase
MSAFDVIVCGSLHLDIILYAPALPRLDETVAGRRWEQKCGGKGGNQAAMAARAGARTAMIGRVGDDAFGAKLLEGLAKAGVDAREVVVDREDASGMSAAIVQDDGEYGAVIVSGANLRVAPAEMEGRWRALGGGRVLALQNEVSEAVNISAAKAAKASGATVVLNAAPARPMTGSLLDLVDVLIVNRVEAGMLAGGSVRTPSQALDAARRLASNRRAVVVTLGGDGLVALPEDGGGRWIAPITVPVVSTHGAGDCFVGALAARLAAGDSLSEAAESANAAAARFVGQLDHASRS